MESSIKSAGTGWMGDDPLENPISIKHKNGMTV
jgi:hypothetical protein